MASAWGRMRDEGQDCPTDEQWEASREADRIELSAEPRPVTADDAGVLRIGTHRAMPSMSAC